jgi:pyruvate dehydrogenase E1 component beta subunit
MVGKRPIVEYQINTATYVSMDQIVNQAAKLSHMSDGQIQVPLTITIPISGAPGALAGQHSDNPYPAFMNYGVKTVIPTTPYDAKGLFRSAVEENDPVMVYFPTVLGSTRGEVPDDSYTVPLGEANVRREGSDVTVVAVGEAVEMALEVADDVDDEIDVEVIDPRTLVPLDEETILESVEKTGRVVVADNANRLCGAAAEIASRIANVGFWSLEAPVKRVTCLHTVPPSFSPPQEEQILADADTIETAVRDLA